MAPSSPLRFPLVAVGAIALLLFVVYTLSSLTRLSLVSRPSVGHTLAQWRMHHPVVAAPSPARADHTFHTLHAHTTRTTQPPDATRAAPQPLPAASPLPPAVADQTFAYNNIRQPSTKLPSARTTQQPKKQPATQHKQPANNKNKKKGLTEEQLRKRKEEVRREAERMLQVMQHREAQENAREEEQSVMVVEGEGKAAGTRGVKSVVSDEFVVLQQQRAASEVRSPNDAALQSLRWPTERATPRVPPSQQTAISRRSKAKGM